LASELVSQLVDSGIHFGHRVSRWNPKMLPYIYGKRNGIHIVDIRETVRGLLRAKKFIAQVVAKGDDVLFVGTKRQAKLLIEQTANRIAMPYVSERWLGGTLTNFRTIRSRLARLEELEREEADGTLQEYSKKMIASRTRELRKIKRNLEGIRNMDKRPGAVIVVDVSRERNALCEARKLKIPTVCLIDTDSDPDFADIPVPGNDDAIRAIEAILGHFADSVDQGKRAREATPKDGDGDARGKRRPAPVAPARPQDAGGAPAADATTTAVAAPAPAAAAKPEAAS